MIRFHPIAILAAFALTLLPAEAAAEVGVSGGVLSSVRMNFENAPDETASDELGFINGEGLRFLFYLGIYPDTLSTGATTFTIEFETEAGDVKSLTFDGVGGPESTGNVTSSAGGVSHALGTYSKYALKVFEIELERDRWTVSGGSEVLLQQAFPYNDDRFTLRYRLGNPAAHPDDGTGLVTIKSQGVFVDHWLTIASPGSPPIPNPPPSSNGAPVVIVSEGATVPDRVFALSLVRLFNATVDALIGKSIATERGDDVYNETGNGQTVVIRRRSNQATFKLSAQNDAWSWDHLRVSGPRKASGCKVTYQMIEKSKMQNVSARVISGGLDTGRLEPDERKNFRVAVRSQKHRSANRSRRKPKATVRVRVESIERPGVVDVVKAVIKGPKKGRAELPSWFKPAGHP